MPAQDDSVLGHLTLLIMRAFSEANRSWIGERQRKRVLVFQQPAEDSFGNLVKPTLKFEK